MSVINQMLKDLDKRQQENPAVLSSAAVNTATKSNNTLLIVLTVVVLGMLSIAGYLFYQNQQLSASLIKQSSIERIEREESDKPTKLKAITSKTSKTTQSNAINFNNKTNENLVNEQLNKNDNAIVASEPKQSENSNNKTVNNKQVQHEVKLVEVAEKALASNLPSQQVDKANNTQKTAQSSASQQTTSEQPKLTISRKKVSAKQLAQQKMAQAEALVQENDLLTAEKRLEEVLMLTPNNKTARKQLAALWFGRHEYQSALNILAQGIALDNQDSEFHLMQARIYLNQGLNKKALQVLQRVKHTSNVEYLATLANVAQQLQDYSQAITSYQQLVNLQPNEARWWLGLAVAYDSNEQYSLAIPAYQSALTQGTLSRSSKQFAKQRIQELEE